DIKELEDQIQTLILPLLKDVFEPWYLQKTYYPKRTGPFAQALCKYADLSLPHTGSGAYSLARKALESLEDSVYKKFLLGEAHLFISDVTKIQKSMVSGYMFNLQSNHHLKKLFFETLKEEPLSKTPTGQPQVNDEFVDVMGMKYEWARLLIEYNKLTKIKGTYIDRFLNEADNGVFYPSFDQKGTISGRYSSDLQQLPRPLEESQASSLVRKYNNELRKNFIAGENHVFIDSDYESLEPHVFAHVSGDKRLTDIFRSGCDFYSTIAIIAEKLNGVSALKKDNNYLGRTQKLTRQNAKKYALGIPYGLGDYGLAKLIDINQSTAKSIIETYLNSYPQLREWMKHTDERVRTIGTISSQAGRVRHLDHAPIIWKENGPIILDGLKLWKKWNGSKKYEEKKEDSRKMKKALKQGKNFQIQSLAASITNRACIAIARELKRKGVDGHVCAQIHDQIIVRVPKDMAEIWRKSVQFMMENTYKLSIPLKAPAEIAHNFYEGH
ncbi:MAG TPA: hypothetical protein DCS66_23485, partial [Flavobacteriaceae bacterium]|nr:hypothetical protein [Flavobacteriaceae bacterium]